MRKLISHGKPLFYLSIWNTCMHACGIINFRKGRTCKIEVVVFYYAMNKQYIHMCCLPSPKGEGHFQDRGTVFLTGPTLPVNNVFISYHV